MSTTTRPSGRKSFFTKQYKKACTSNASLRDPSKKQLPLEVADPYFSDSMRVEIDDEPSDLKWFFKNREARGLRWSRLHLGLGSGHREQSADECSLPSASCKQLPSVKSVVQSAVALAGQSAAALAGQAVLGISDHADNSQWLRDSACSA
jgi:hypothetical protein